MQFKHYHLVLSRWHAQFYHLTKIKLMLYKLLHHLFGWDYIYWQNSCDQGIARVHRSSCGKVFYYRYKCIRIIDVIDQPSEVIWLTCKPSKYLKTKKQN